MSRKAAGIRTNLLICMGSALFLRFCRRCWPAMPTRTRDAWPRTLCRALVFWAAGLILHNRSRVSGLTSAASVFVVASIGMACGAGLYAAAAVAAVIVIVALEAVGLLERNANLKMYPMVYEARGSDQNQMLESILDAMDKAKTAAHWSGAGQHRRVAKSELCVDCDQETT